jgi:hypothetical protein
VHTYECVKNANIFAAKAFIYLYQKTFDKNVLTPHDMDVNDNESHEGLLSNQVT